MMFTLCGALGSILAVATYAGVLQGRLPPDSPLYPALSLLATALMSLSLVSQWNLGSAMSGLAFGSVSLWGLFVTLRQRIGMDLIRPKKKI